MSLLEQSSCHQICNLKFPEYLALEFSLKRPGRTVQCFVVMHDILAEWVAMAFPKKGHVYTRATGRDPMSPRKASDMVQTCVLLDGTSRTKRLPLVSYIVVTIQHDKWVSGARFMIDYHRPIAPSLVRSLARSIDPSVDRSLARSLTRSLDRSLDNKYCLGVC